MCTARLVITLLQITVPDGQFLSVSSILTVLFANIDCNVGERNCVTIFAAVPMFAASYLPVRGVFHGLKALEVQARSRHSTLSHVPLSLALEE